LGAAADDIRSANLYYGEGCEVCHHTGYKGRMGIFEILMISDAMRVAVHAQASTGELRTIAIGEGMNTLRQAGLKAVLDGRTTLEEALRETSSL